MNLQIVALEEEGEWIVNGDESKERERCPDADMNGVKDDARRNMTGVQDECARVATPAVGRVRQQQKLSLSRLTNGRGAHLLIASR